MVHGQGRYRDCSIRRGPVTAFRRFLITQDLDCSDVRQFAPGTDGWLLVQLRRPGRHALTRRVRALFQTEEVDEWSGCLVVATEGKLRIRRPPDAE